jgi:hypothetical protein
MRRLCQDLVFTFQQEIRLLEPNARVKKRLVFLAKTLDAFFC